MGWTLRALYSLDTLSLWTRVRMRGFPWRPESTHAADNTTTHSPATDLGYLLGKTPAVRNRLKLRSGKHMFLSLESVLVKKSLPNSLSNGIETGNSDPEIPNAQ